MGKMPPVANTMVHLFLVQCRNIQAHRERYMTTTVEINVTNLKIDSALMKMKSDINVHYLALLSC
jgi:hypothetical protein